MDDFLSDALFRNAVDPVTKTNWYGKEIGKGKVRLALWVMAAVGCGVGLVSGFVWFIIAVVQSLKRRQRQTDEEFARELQQANEEAQEQGM